MRRTRLKVVLLFGVLGLSIFCLPFSWERGLAQDVKSKPTIVADDTFGKGGTKETQSDEKYRLEREVWKDSAGTVREKHVLYYPKKGSPLYVKEGQPYEEGWGFYDASGREVLTISLKPHPNPGGRWNGLWDVSTTPGKQMDGYELKEALDLIEKLEKETVGKLQSSPEDSAISPKPEPADKGGIVPKEQRPSIINDIQPMNVPDVERPKNDDKPKSETPPEAGSSKMIETPATHSFAAPGFKISIDVNSGLMTIGLTIPKALIKVYIPSRLAPGDKISGTIEEQAAGNKEAELDKYSLEFRNELRREVERARNERPTDIYIPGRFKLPRSPINLEIPPPGSRNFIWLFLLRDKQEVAWTELPVLSTTTETPSGFSFPTGGQQGQLLVMNGPFDGNISKTDFVNIGGKSVSILAESPRVRIARNTSDVIGPSKIESGENGQVSECPFRSLGIKMTADKLGLLKGEATGLHVLVLGLADIGQDVPLALINHSSDVVLMSEGDEQHIIIPMAKVKSDGTYPVERTLTGIMAGKFNITATVTWEDQCKPRAEVMKGPKHPTSIDVTASGRLPLPQAEPGKPSNALSPQRLHSTF